MSDWVWNVQLVNEGIEHVRVHSNGITKFDGSVPAGYCMHLTIGDSVSRKTRLGWRKKFGVILTRRGRPVLVWGNRRTVLAGNFMLMSPEERIKVSKDGVYIFMVPPLIA